MTSRMTTANKDRKASATTEVIIWIAVAAAVGALMFYARSSRSGGGNMGVNHAAVGKKLMGVSLDVLTGGGEKITTDSLEGHVTLVNFWGTWCPPCRVEFPHIVKLNDEFRDKEDFQFVSISVPGKEKSVEQLRANTQEFLDQRPTDFPTYVDLHNQTSNAVTTALNEDGMGLPLTLVIGPDGTIRGVWQGYAAGVEKEMQSLLSELLKD